MLVRAICENCRFAAKYYCTEQEARKISRKESCFFIIEGSMDETERLAYLFHCAITNAWAKNAEQCGSYEFASFEERAERVGRLTRGFDK